MADSAPDAFVDLFSTLGSLRVYAGMSPGFPCGFEVSTDCFCHIGFVLLIESMQQVGHGRSHFCAVDIGKHLSDVPWPDSIADLFE
jgi:hypothetical protein